ncbi:hypothetical protein Tco_0027471 [Tanacetum coccineum]
MTTPRLTPFPATTPRARVFALFVIISDSDDEITTLPVRPAPPLPDHIPALHGYPLDSGDDLSDEDLNEKGLDAARLQSCRNRWRVDHLLLSQYLPFEYPGASLASAMQETMTLRARVGSLEQHDMITRESLRISKGMFTRSQLRAKYVEKEVRELREFWVTDRFRMAKLRRRAHDRECSFWSYEALIEIKTSMACESMSQIEQQKDKVAENARNKRKWEGTHGGSSSQQQNKEHKLKMPVIESVKWTLQEWLSRKEEPEPSEQAMKRKNLWRL